MSLKYNSHSAETDSLFDDVWTHCLRLEVSL